MQSPAHRMGTFRIKENKLCLAFLELLQTCTVSTGNPRGQGKLCSFSTAEETSAYWNKFEGGEKDSRQSDSGRLILKDDPRN